MKLRMLILVSLLFVGLFPVSVFGSTWARSYGGPEDESANSIQKTSDGGFIVVGSTQSYGAGSYDVWVLKLDAIGDVQWQKTYGVSAWDLANSIHETSDGGFIVAGSTFSSGTDGYDVWAMKLNAIGDVDWKKTYSGSDSGSAAYIQETSDGGFVVAGSTCSYGAGDSDIWVIKLNAIGDVQWQKTYGGSEYDRARSIQKTSDGKFVVAGVTESYGAGDYDIWVMKLNATGNVEWQKTYGGPSEDIAAYIQVTSDGGFIVASSTQSYGAGGRDIWVMKLNAIGDVQWQKTYGGPSLENANSIQETSDDGFVVTGFYFSTTNGLRYAWVLKLNAIGDVQWQKTYGGGSERYNNSFIQETSDGGFVVACSTWSYGSGEGDIWLLKLNANGNLPGCDLGENTSVTTIISTATAVVSTSSPRPSSAVPRNTNVLVENTHTAVNTQCGTCEGQCGRKGKGDCWCDASCTSYGDCCLDYGKWCPKTCKDHCGGQSAGDCWCDAVCTLYGDCCPDYDPLCNPDPDPEPEPEPECITMADCPKGNCASEPGIGHYECINGQCECLPD